MSRALSRSGSGFLHTVFVVTAQSGQPSGRTPASRRHTVRRGYAHRQSPRRGEPVDLDVGTLAVVDPVVVRMRAVLPDCECGACRSCRLPRTAEAEWRTQAERRWRLQSQTWWGHSPAIPQVIAVGEEGEDRTLQPDVAAGSCTGVGRIDGAQVMLDDEPFLLPRRIVSRCDDDGGPWADTPALAFRSTRWVGLSSVTTPSSVWCDTPGPYPPTMSTSEATRLARIVVADLGHADDHAKRLGAVILLLADEVDRLPG